MASDSAFKSTADHQPGTDFFASVQKLFDEANAKGLNSSNKVDFKEFKSSVVLFLAVCNQMTRAKARASASVRFPDGTEPMTTLVLPPSDLRIDTKLRNRLLKQSSGREFVGLLVSFYYALRNRGKPKAPYKKRKVQTETTTVGAPTTEAEPKAKRLKLTVRCIPCTPFIRITDNYVQVKAKESPECEQEANSGASDNAKTAVPEEPASLTLPIQTRKDVENITAGVRTGSPDPITGASYLAGSGSVVAAERDSQPVVDGEPSGTDEAINGVSEKGIDQTGEAKQPDEDVISDDSDDEEFDGQLPNEEQTADGIGLLDEKYKPQSENEMMLEEIGSRAERIVPGSERMVKKRLIKRLREESSVAADTFQPRNTLNEVTRLLVKLDEAIWHVSEHTSLLDPKLWAQQRLKLVQFCTSQEILDSDQRLRKIVRLIYIPEELRLMNEGKWNVLEAIARICGAVAMMLGPEAQASSQTGPILWIRAKIRDHKSLKVIMETARRSLGSCLATASSYIQG